MPSSKKGVVILSVLSFAALLINVSFFIYPYIAKAVTAAGPNNGGVFSGNVSGAGNQSWSNPSNAKTSDNSYTQVNLDDFETSRYLKVTNFNFNIPFGSAINGIKVEVERNTNGSGKIKDYSIKLVKNNVIGGDNKAITTPNATGLDSNGFWQAGNDQTITYGSNTDLWGQSWTYADINSSDFGVVFSATKPTNQGNSVHVSLDHIKITVFYTMLLDQTITFDPINDKSFRNPDFNVSATASSGLPVTFTASGDCTVSSNTIHLVSVGNCTVTAHQTGNGTYNPATDVSQSFSILNNLIINPSVEDGNLTPDYWNNGGYGTNIHTFTYPSESPDGLNKKGVQVNISSYPDRDPNIGGDAKWYFNNVPVTPGQYYVFSDQYKSNIDSQVVIEYHNINNTLSYAEIAILSPSPNWSTFTSGFVVPNEVDSLTIYHIIRGVGTLNLDNYSLIESVNPNTFDKGMVSLTFDDGWQSVYDNGLPILDTAGFKSTQYIISQIIGEPGYMTDEEITAMKNNGHEIVSHTQTHPDLLSLSADNLKHEIFGSRYDLFNRSYGPVDSLAFPYGYYNSTIKGLLKNAGYAGGRSVDTGYNDKASDHYALKVQPVERGGSCDGGTPAVNLDQIKGYIDNAAANKLWLILLFHQIDNNNENCYGIEPVLLQQIVDYLKTSNVDVKTVSEGLHQLNDTPAAGDTVAPVIANHNDISVSSNSATIINYTLPTVTDNLDTDLTAYCLPMPGSLFQAGNTTVTCRAADTSGNISSTSFIVSVGIVDTDNDGVTDSLDNCPVISNADQLDTDNDGVGDVCDSTPNGDTDNDGIDNNSDNCPSVANPGQEDLDNDGLGDTCDDDKDGDTVDNSTDNCPTVSNTDQTDTNNNGIGDACDGDDDGDGIVDFSDNCPFISNLDQTDTDNDGIGDVCDTDDDNDGLTDTQEAVLGTNPLNPDSDSDNVSDGYSDPDGDDSLVIGPDNCPTTSNHDQLDTDWDGVGDACDEDDDNDGVADSSDNCPTIANADQTDIDHDGIGDTCDSSNDDTDGDGVNNDTDNCPLVSNANQTDTDNDGIGDACDSINNNDTDNDGVNNNSDNCPVDANPGQEDSDNDDIGNACDDTNNNDTDDDGIDNEEDNCPNIANSDQGDFDGDGIGNLCDSTPTGSTSESSGSGGGGGGGGGGGTPEPTLIVEQESVITTIINETAIQIEWNTNLPASSYVIYSEEGQPHLLELTDISHNPPHFGYQYATPEIDTNPKVNHHVVTITGLNPLTTYYFRVVSRGSLAYGWEYQFRLGQDQNVPIVELPLDGQVAFGSPAGIQGTQITEEGGELPSGETKETNKTEEETAVEEGNNLFNFLAALPFAPGLKPFFSWLWQNLWWIIILLLILVAIYYYWKNREKQKQEKNK